MSFKIFYAWQSDWPNNVCRNLVRGALNQAAKRLNAELEVEDAVREVTIDQDTQDVAGSPAIAETILQKIRECDAFVADLTFLPTVEGQRLTPNPNVLIEYGYALHAVGDRRIVGVFNRAFGSPEELPFDLRHKRWPISYDVAEAEDSDAAKLARKTERDKLTEDLTRAIRSILAGAAQEPARAVSSPYITTSEQAGPNDLPERGFDPRFPSSSYGIVHQYPWEGGELGIRDNLQPTDEGYRVRLIDGPSIHIKLESRASSLSLSNVQAKRAAQEALQPMDLRRLDGPGFARGRHGAVTFAYRTENPGEALTASLLTPNGHLYGIDRYLLQVAKFRDVDAPGPYVPTGAVERVLVDTLRNFLAVARHSLELQPPFEVAAGLEGIGGYRLAVDRKKYGEQYVGGFLYDSVGWTMQVDSFGEDPFDVLLPLFDKIYDEGGYERRDDKVAG